MQRSLDVFEASEADSEALSLGREVFAHGTKRPRDDGEAAPVFDLSRK